MNTQRFFIFAGGGSGGHLFPGLAAAEALKRAEAEAEIIFLATQRPIDEKILKNSGFRFKPQPVQPIPHRVGQLWPFWQGWRSSVRMCGELFKRSRPAAVLGLGGFASGPAMKAAEQMQIPVGMINPDAVPGRANRFGIKRADRIFLQWQQSMQYFGSAAGRCVVTGCPIRRTMVENIQGVKPPEERVGICLKLGLDAEKKILLVMGGSQGGRTINRAIVSCLKGAAKGWNCRWQIVHLAGESDHEWVRQEYRQTDWQATVWAFCDQMDVLLPLAGLVVGRAGASSLAELTAAGVPSILMPYPYHKDQHQLRNAEILASSGAAKIVRDDPNNAEATASALLDPLRQCLAGPEIIAEMGQRALTLGRPDAADAVARELIALAERSKKG
jgi:UDP-N-acetylglucosamine--N-acetylmuramyl-(pentapeptide) pyrophosphoryl-undecaprenol N-acetylglucosamine transferase